MLESWEDLHLRDLFYAFRKAKTDRFFETSVRVAEKFINYEQNLSDNLQTLLIRLQNGEIESVIESQNISVVVLPKRTRFIAAKNSLHVHWSNFNREKSNWPKKSLKPEFRFVGDFSVEHHILSALWINQVGHKYDAALGKSAIASRLRRYKSNGPKQVGNYHLDAIGSFEPYYGPYKDWRDGGLRALEQSLKANNDVAAITLDISNFYHSVDPTFATEPEFLRESGIALNAWELRFTSAIVGLIRLWHDKCISLMAAAGCDQIDIEETGLPIGLSASRLLSNVFLFSLDKELERNLSPVYYSRYVDDIFLVINDRSQFSSQSDLVNFISEKVPSFRLNEENLSLEYSVPGWANNSVIKFGSEKQKIFFLSGASGLDLLTNISEQIK